MNRQSRNAFRFIIYSLFGIFMFFVPIEIAAVNSIPLDHLVSLIRDVPMFELVYGSLLIIIGTLLPFIRKTWNKDKVTMVLSLIQLTAIPFLIFYLFKIGPQALLADDMIPFIFESIVVPVTTIIPIGSVFLAFIVGYGLMEYIGVLMRPIMVPLFKTPGRSAVDAVASFVGSYSIALLLTNRVYREGRYTDKEAAIIATGFSTVSATFMIIVAKTAGLMDQWLLYFTTTIIVTFTVTILTTRLYPLASFPENYFEGQAGKVEQDVQGNRFKAAWEEAMEVADRAPSLGENVLSNLRDGFNMALKIAPSLMSVGIIALIIANYTPFFDILGYIFYPFTWLLQLPEPMLAAKAASLSIAEMFLPSLLVVDADPVVQYVIAIVCISEILFFSASIPCIMSTDIPLKLKDYLIIWFERVVLSLIIATPIVYWLFV
ncbi:YjiH family protein [Aerococcus kribbianus]|uniref:YjiH family protein n=1 Tax=Aerococcus kribbianus TaxID=2999064 RepID=A0A9X3FS61_9LACT|nr:MULTISPECIES: YjiH family protein [unclassified Aerococcus]MCZ0717422.1 YjiH family protein [Aerococcus sp. YH-aer221]MCZ0725710.1 YjiH family protein [Aerococcus sp. YH-aer222]